MAVCGADEEGEEGDVDGEGLVGVGDVGGREGGGGGEGVVGLSGEGREGLVEGAEVGVYCCFFF